MSLTRDESPPVAVSATPEPRPGRAASSESRLWLRDSLVFAVVVAASVLPYVWSLGFSSDDWVFLSRFQQAADQSLPGLLDVADMGSRPVQAVWLAVLYRLFGLDATGFHVANALTLLAMAVAFSGVLRRLALPRAVVVSVPLVYVLLPHYSTDRFWVAAFQANLCVLFLLVGAYAALRSFDERGARSWLAVGLALGSLVLSGLAYEVSLPLFVAVLAVVWIRHRALTRAGAARRPQLLALLGGVVLLMVGLAIFKQRTASRLGAEDGLLNHLRALLRHAIDPSGSVGEYGFNVRRAVTVNFVDLGLALPRAVWRLGPDVDAVALLATFVIAAVAAVYVFRATSSRRMSDRRSGLSLDLQLLAAGVIVFFGGYAVFLTNWNIQLTPTGIGNRTAVAAALGVALVAVALFALLARLAPSTTVRRGVFAGLVAVATACGGLVNVVTAYYWVDADEEAQQILAGIERALPDPEPGTTVLLDGTCRYDGPAVVFEANWDLAGALHLRYGRTDIAADVIKPEIDVDDDGISLWLYNTESHYPYGDDLVVFNAADGRLYPMTDERTARRYLTGPGAASVAHCPPGIAGRGSPLF